MRWFFFTLSSEKTHFQTGACVLDRAHTFPLNFLFIWEKKNKIKLGKRGSVLSSTQEPVVSHTNVSSNSSMKLNMRKKEITSTQSAYALCDLLFPCHHISSE